MEQEAIVIHFNVWLLLAATCGGFSILVWIIWALLKKVSTMTIAGIHNKIKSCEHELRNEIGRALSVAESAHVRVGAIEHTLMLRGVEIADRHGDRRTETN